MDTSTILEYKCPCCDAPLAFSQESQKLACGSCGNDFEIEAVKEYNDTPEGADGPDFSWAESATQPWEDAEGMTSFECPSCCGQIITDGTTAATFCPYCGNPAVMPTRLSGVLKPDAVIPFKTTKKDAQDAFLRLCKGKPLLPKDFKSQQRLDQITGTYVPFWLYNCDSRLDGKYRATRVHTWSDSNYRYTKTDHYLLTRSAEALFDGIPMDGSTKMDDTAMESIEPFDYSQLVDFDTAYLSGFLADKYDVEAKDGEGRIRQRVSNTMDERIAATCIGYSSVIPVNKNLRITHSKAKYVLLPVWVMTTRYKDQLYTFAMNGQTGKMTGRLPICAKKSWAWFLGIFAGVAALSGLIMWLV